jgi:hypothetical protein
VTLFAAEGGRAMLVELSVVEQRYHAVMEVISGAPVPHRRRRLRLTTSPDPHAHHLGGQPVPARLGFNDRRNAIVRPHRISPPGKEECGHVYMQRLARLIMAVDLDVDGMAEQCPTGAIVILHIMTGVQEISQLRQVFHLNRLMSG